MIHDSVGVHPSNDFEDWMIASEERKRNDRISDELQEKIDQFEEREDALRERFQDATV